MSRAGSDQVGARGIVAVCWVMLALSLAYLNLTRD